MPIENRTDTRTAQMPRPWLRWIGIGLLALAATAVLWKGPLPLEALLLQAAAIDQNVRNGLLLPDPDQLRRVVRFQIVAWSLLGVAMAWFPLLPARLWSSLRPRAFQVSIALGCSSALFLLLMRCGSEATWYPLEVLINNPSALPVFGHRLLWVWVADLIHRLAPSLSYSACYLLSQIPPTILAIVVIGEWSALFIQPSLRWIGQLLLVPMLATTFSYFNFFDISIVFFYALCLLLLYRRRFVAFAVVVGVATLNHENALLLVVLAGFETLRYGKRTCAAVTLGSLSAHLAARFLIQYVLPTSKFVDWRIWTNLIYPFIHPRLLIESALALAFWWIAAGVAWPSVDPFLRRAAILLPMLLAVTFLFGQFHEPRQFDAMIPVVIGFIVSFANARIERTNPVPMTDAAAI
jgi:hypothetical protein